MPDDLEIKVAGHTDGNILYFSPSVHMCGRITNGVGVYFSPRRGSFVLDFADLEKAYLAAKKFREELSPTVRKENERMAQVLKSAEYGE